MKAVRFVSCHLGGHDTDNIVSLTNVTHEGRVIPFACLDHAKEYGLWCEVHDEARQGYPPDPPGCNKCITMLQIRYASNAGYYLNKLRLRLNPEVWAELVEYMDPQPGVIDMYHRGNYLTRLLAIRAVCNGVDMEAVVQSVIKAQSIDPILPNPYKDLVAEAVPVNE